MAATTGVTALVVGVVPPSPDVIGTGGRAHIRLIRTAGPYRLIVRQVPIVALIRVPLGVDRIGGNRRWGEGQHLEAAESRP